MLIVPSSPVWSKYVIETWSWRIHCWMEVLPLVWKFVILVTPRLFILKYYYILVHSFCVSSWFFHCNFCIFRFLQSSVLHSQPKSTVGTPAYIAPEILLRQEYDGKVCGSPPMRPHSSVLVVNALNWHLTDGRCMVMWCDLIRNVGWSISIWGSSWAKRLSQNYTSN